MIRPPCNEDVDTYVMSYFRCLLSLLSYVCRHHALSRRDTYCQPCYPVG